MSSDHIPYNPCLDEEMTATAIDRGPHSAREQASEAAGAIETLARINYGQGANEAEILRDAAQLLREAYRGRENFDQELKAAYQRLEEPVTEATYYHSASVSLYGTKKRYTRGCAELPAYIKELEGTAKSHEAHVRHTAELGRAAAKVRKGLKHQGYRQRTPRKAINELLDLIERGA